MFNTDHGDLQLFKLLEPLLSQALPRESVEWKRTYGNPPRAVSLDASFEPFVYEDNIFETSKRSQGNKILGCQVLHTYWIECPVR